MVHFCIVVLLFSSLSISVVGQDAADRAQGSVLQSSTRGRALAFSHDGALLASAGVIAVKLFDVDGRRELGTFSGDAGIVWALAFSPDDRWLASGGVDKIARLWDVKNRRQIRAFTGHTAEIQSLAFSSDGRWLFSVGQDATVIRWDTTTGEASATVSHPTQFGEREAVALSADGLWLAEASGDGWKQGWRLDGEISVWEATTDRKAHTLDPPIAEVLVIAISPDGRWVAAGTQERRVYIWDLEAGRLKHQLDHYDGWVVSLSFSADSRLLAAGSSDDSTIGVWDVDTGKQLATLAGHREWVRAVAFRPDGSTVASIAGDGSLRFWDLASGREVALFSGFEARGPGLAFTADGRRLAVASDGGVIRLWQVGTWREIEGFRGCEGYYAAYFAIAFSPDTRWMVSSDSCRALNLWDVGTRKVAQTLAEGQGISRLAFSPDGRLLAWAGSTTPPGGSSSRSIYVLEMETGKILRSWKEDRFDRLKRMEFLTNRRLFITTSFANIEVRDLDEEDPVLFRPHRGDSVAIDGTGEVLALASNRRIRWSDLSYRTVRFSSLFAGRLELLRFSPDGRWLASAGSDFTIRLWDVASGREVHSFRGHTEGMIELLFSPDGRWLVSGSRDKSVRVWDLSGLDHSNLPPDRSTSPVP